MADISCSGYLFWLSQAGKPLICPASAPLASRMKTYGLRFIKFRLQNAALS